MTEERGTSGKGNSIQKKRQMLRLSRIVIQIVAFLFMPSLFSQAFSAVKETAAGIGSAEVLTMTDFVIRLLVLCGITVLCGRIFCGWLCAFGAFNDWIYQISAFLQKKLKKKLPKIPESFVPILQKIKYVILLGIIIVCFLGKGEYISKNSPWTVFSLLTAGNFSLGKYGVGIALGVLLILGMAMHERFFCQFFCPMGAVFSLLPELPVTALHREEKNCIKNCQACKKNCPVHIKIGEDSLKQGECIRCGRCMLTCPGKNISMVCLPARQISKKEERSL